MLVLSRKQQQEIVIGDDIKITVLKVKGNTVRLGIDAPRDVRVIRGELPRKEDEQQIANVTVVFNDHVERSSEKPTREVEVLKFENSRDENSRDENTRSISFRQVAPPMLKHNRLKQIAQDISKRNVTKSK